MRRIPKILTVAVVVAVVGLLMGAVPVAAKTAPGNAGVQAGDKGATPADKAPRAPQKAPEGKVSLNSASVEQLQTLPRVGAKMAQRIVDYRTANKGFKTIEELRNVKGIGPKVFESLKPFLTL